MKPLDGVKVIDFTQGHGGSLATMILADFGAEIIKIERIVVGDIARHWKPMKNGNSAYYAYLNRGKKSISLDTSTEEGRKIVLELINGADVLCENSEYGTIERMGLSYDLLKQDNPGLIYASLSGFGQTGPLKGTIGLDLQAQAMSGLMDRTGFADGPPTKVGAPIGDHIGGTYMAMAINLALINRRTTGEGQKIDIAMLDSLSSVLEAFPIMYCLEGEVPRRFGNSYPAISPYDVYKTNDGYVAIGVSTDAQWLKFCDVFGMEEAKNDEKYATNELRGEHYDFELRPEIEAVTLKMSKFEIERLLREAKLACGAVCTVVEAMESEQLKIRKMLVEIDDKALGKIEMPGIVIKMSETPGEISASAPLLGEHTVFYLSQLGYRFNQIRDLVDRKIAEAI